MAVTTTEYNLEPEDGWTEISNAASTFILVGLDTNSKWEFYSGASAPADSPTAATQTLTLLGNAVADETITINSTTLTFKASAANENEITIGGTAAETVTAIVAAINTHSVLGGLVYATDGTGDTVDIEAVVAGSGANSYATTETMTNGSWGAATMAGGADTAVGVSMSGSFMAAGGIADNAYIRAVVPGTTKFNVIAAV